jgi:leader peptidase (prepilin peptidase)/N-methyltransferase
VIATILAVVGAATGSFAALVVERRRRGEQWVRGRSHCRCGRVLPAIENLPVVGWLWLRGRSRCCQEAIPRRYLIIEASMAGTGALAGLLEPPPVGVAVAAASWMLIALLYARATRASS